MKILPHFLVACQLIGTAAIAAERHPIAADVAAKLGGAEQPFVLLVELRVDADQADALIEAMANPTKQTAKEPGNVLYNLSQDSEKPGRFVLYEEWKDVAALDSHLKQPYLVKLLADFDRLLSEPPKLTVLRPIPVNK